MKESAKKTLELVEWIEGVNEFEFRHDAVIRTHPNTVWEKLKAIAALIKKEEKETP